MKKLSYIFLLIFSFANGVFGQTLQPISVVRTLANGTAVKTSGIITNGPSFDSRNRIRSFQDGTGDFSGMAVFGTGLPDLQALQVGDSVVITGELAQFNANQQIVGTTANPLVIQKIASGKTLPATKVLTLAELENPAIAEKYENMLVKVQEIFVDTSDEFFGSGSAGRSYDLDDPTNLKPGNCFPLKECNPVMRINPGNGMVGLATPKGLATISGILGDFNASYQISPRGQSDFEVGLVITNLSQTSFSGSRIPLSWKTSIAADARVRWGSLKLKNTSGVYAYDTTYVGEIVKADFTTERAIEIIGLFPANIYFVNITCKTQVGKRAFTNDFYSTQSESTGEIKVYFNNKIDATLAKGNPIANYSTNVASLIAKQIDLAQNTVDIAVYNSNLSGAGGSGASAIITALNNAYSRGVKVRYIYNAATTNASLAALNTNILRMKDGIGTRTSGIMHNKFVVVDAESPLNAWVLTGSGNHTDQNLNKDPNNFIFIQDQTLARAYTTEFEEMWGLGPVTGSSSTATDAGNQPKDITTSFFGDKKIKNTPSQYQIGGKRVELYFSPSDNVSSAIQRTIYTTNSDLRFNLLLMTDDGTATAIDSVQNVLEQSNVDEIGNTILGKQVRGLVDDGGANPENGVGGAEVLGDKIPSLREKGVNVQTYLSANQLHHKYVVIDANTTSDPLVLTGSHNWSSSANTINDENTLIIHDKAIAMQYIQEFGERYFEATGVRDSYLTAIDADLSGQTTVFPNPNNGIFQVRLAQENIKTVQIKILDLSGKVAFTQAYTPQNKIIGVQTTGLKQGLYLVQIEINGSSFVKKLLVD
jgi:phosphatidylserine/phosphatidylglycerophosphate/cardiolipin synthase-like enzyme